MSDPLLRMDLNLLLVFEALMEERNVTRAAQRLLRSQPAVSASLTRLRESFDDPLFVRARSGMVPTPRAVQLAASIKPVMPQLRDAVQLPPTFDPGLSDHIFTVGAVDALELFMGSALVRAMSQVAPRAKLRITAVERQADILNEREEIDVVLTVLTGTTPAWMRTEKLGDTSYLMLFDEQTIGTQAPISLDAYLAARHLLVSFQGDFYGLSDQALAEQGLKRDVAVVTPRFSPVPFMIHGTDLIATLPTYVARAMTLLPGLVVQELPFALPSVELVMCWHRRVDDDPARKWFRTLLSRTFAERWAASLAPRA